MKLYEIGKAYLDVLENVLSEDVDEEQRADIEEQMTGMLEDKLAAVAAHIKNTEAEAAAIKTAIDAMQARLKSKNNSVNFLKQYMIDWMTRTDHTAFETPQFAVKVKAKPPAVQVNNEELIPGPYIVTKTVTSVNKKDILADLKSGKEIPGCELYQGKRLDIK
jgi:hypothetical protein